MDLNPVGGTKDGDHVATVEDGGDGDDDDDDEDTVCPYPHFLNYLFLYQRQGQKRMRSSADIFPGLREVLVASSHPDPAEARPFSSLRCHGDKHHGYLQQSWSRKATVYCGRIWLLISVSTCTCTVQLWSGFVEESGEDQLQTCSCLCSLQKLWHLTVKTRINVSYTTR